MSGRDPGAEDGTGSLAEEAAALFTAIAEQASRHGDHFDPATAGGDNCRWCPLCQAIGVVRGTSPEVRELLVTSAGTLLLALRELVEQVARGPGDGATGSGTGTERIAVSDDTDEGGSERWD